MAKVRKTPDNEEERNGLDWSRRSGAAAAVVGKMHTGIVYYES